MCHKRLLKLTYLALPYYTSIDRDFGQGRLLSNVQLEVSDKSFCPASDVIARAQCDLPIWCTTTA